MKARATLSPHVNTSPAGGFPITLRHASIYLQSRTAAPAEKEKGEKRTVFQLFNSVCVKVYNSFVQKSRFHKDLSFSSSSLLQFLPYFSDKSTADSICQTLKYNRTDTKPRCIWNIKLQEIIQLQQRHHNSMVHGPYDLNKENMVFTMIRLKKVFCKS